ncbi:cell death activator CIDE-B-like isoform X1 [Polistes fuscatus]|uniref:cell death activator CIDE-B-like isoform X1 n=1 Tax=Polistes fuscatus TaxID=30207 RepID=UPI001CA99112|nr:cell death activator CIDE-B-like isoform X1 [Polistes fuscatus]
MSSSSSSPSCICESRSKRPFKIWDSWRNVRKGLVVSNFEELIHRGKEKLGVPQNENVSLVLESDGTQVEGGEYFKTLANNTILLLLRHGERWCPTGVDIIRAGTYYFQTPPPHNTISYSK